MAEKMGFFERRGFEKFKKSQGFTGKRKGDIRLPSRTESAAREGLSRLAKGAASGAKQTVSRALSRKK